MQRGAQGGQSFGVWGGTHAHTRTHMKTKRARQPPQQPAATPPGPSCTRPSSPHPPAAAPSAIARPAAASTVTGPRLPHLQRITAHSAPPGRRPEGTAASGQSLPGVQADRARSSRAEGAERAALSVG
jgi:hypothetical protein